MKEVGKILLYCVTVVAGGALLAPLLYWAGRWAVDRNIIPALQPFGFPRYFNRSIYILALGLLWPLLRWMGLRHWTDLHLAPNPRRWFDLGLGILLGMGGFGLVAAGLVESGLLQVREHCDPQELWGAMLTGGVVALIEESFFRGALLGLLRRNLRWPIALAFLSVLFAVLHFVRPDSGSPPPANVTWLSGFALLPHMFWQFGNLNLVVGTWLTLLLVGLTLGYAVIRTASLYLAIGMHASWVCALKLLMAWTRRQGEPSIWLGQDLRCGLVPAALIFATWALLPLLLRPRDAKMMHG